jgi:hypothetical protein
MHRSVRVDALLPVVPHNELVARASDDDEATVRGNRETRAVRAEGGDALLFATGKGAAHDHGGDLGAVASELVGES